MVGAHCSRVIICFGEHSLECLVADGDVTLGILVRAGTEEHLVQFFVRHRLVQLHGYRFQIVKSDVAITILIKENEGLVEGVLLVSLTHLLHHDG